MDFTHLMETFTNPNTIHSLHIFDKMIVSGFSMFIGISVTIATLTIVYIAMKLLAIACNTIITINKAGGMMKMMRGKKNANASNNINANTDANMDDSTNDADVVAISAAIHAYYAPKLQAGNRIVIKNIIRGETKTRFRHK